MKKKITANWISPKYEDSEGFVHEQRAWIKGHWFYLRDKDLDSESGQKTGYEHIHKIRFLRYCQNIYAFEVWDNKNVFGI